MRNDNDKKTSLILSACGVVPVVWLALLTAPYVGGGIVEIIRGLTDAMGSPFAITVCEDSVKTVLIFLAAYGMAIGIYFSTRRNYRRREEHGSAKWGNADALNKKYRDKDPSENKLLTQNVRIGLDGKKHRRNLNILVCGGSGAGKTRFFCKPNAMQCNTSFVVLDPKGEIVRNIACGAISGFHSLVGSGTTAKQLNNERDARPIAYGGMLIESALAIISLCAVAYIWKDYADGTTVVPTAVFAGGLSSMLGTLFGAGAQKVTYSLLILAVSAFCLTSLDTATRLARYMFQEFWMKPGENIKDMTGARKVLTNPYVSTAITVVLGVALGMTGYAKIWALFGAANQLLAALGLLAVAAWLGKIGRNNKMFYFPMAFMLIVTLTSLVFTIKAQIGLITTGADVTWGVIRAVIAVLLIILAIDLVIEGVKALSKQAKAKTAAAE